ncbi:MAG: amino acid permease [Nannocystaceae bacterium]
MAETSPPAHEQSKLSWKEGLYLVGPDPLTSPYYSSGALIVAGVGYATPAFQIGLYALLFLLAPLYIEAVLLTLSNGGTYVMTRYALSHLGKLAIGAAALVGVIISFSYVATAIVSLLSYSDYVTSLVSGLPSGKVAAAIGLSALPSLGFGAWVMPKQWRRTVATVGITSLLALALSAVFPAGVVVMLAPLMLLFALNNHGLKESVQVSRTIFLVNLVVMGITIVMALLYLAIHGGHLDLFLDGATLPKAALAAELAASEAGPAAEHGMGHATARFLPGFATLGAALIPAALGSSILGASGVESVMNIPEELQTPRTDVRKIYMWMLSILMVIGGSLSLLVFLVLPPAQLVGASGYLLAVLGEVSVTGVTGSELLGSLWNVVIVANAALMLLGATNTGFAGARGLWVTMARDSLLPRRVLNTNERGAFSRINLLMLAAIFVLAWEGDADVEILERWYGATFGLVMFSGVLAFILLRRFKGDDPRIYWAPFNVKISGVKMPVAALIGLAFLSFALLGLYTRYAEQIRSLQSLLTGVGVLVGLVLLSYNHRQLIRTGYRYFRRVIETVEGGEIETGERTIVVAVGGVRMGGLIQQAVSLARAQSRTTGIPYKQIVVFHMTKSVGHEYVYRVRRDSLRPAGIEGNAVRIHTELTELAPSDLNVFLALVPQAGEPSKGRLHQAMDTLVDFHERHGFRGHIVMIGDYGVSEQDVAALQERLEGSTLVSVPV